MSYVLLSKQFHTWQGESERKLKRNQRKNRSNAFKQRGEENMNNTHQSWWDKKNSKEKRKAKISLQRDKIEK